MPSKMTISLDHGGDYDMDDAERDIFLNCTILEGDHSAEWSH